MNNFLRFFLAFFTISALFFSCRTTNGILQEENASDEVTLFFAGDIMAHRPNYSMKNFNKIYESITEPIKKADFSFANIEAPVDDTVPYSTYPNFNMNSPYPKAAIDAGFNVFSIVNNHMNDQGLHGIKETVRWAKKTEQDYAEKERPVWICGLNESPHSPISYKILKKDGWNILFVAVTEILNRPDYRSYMNYVTASKAGWQEFSEYLLALIKENSPDLTVLSIHTDEPEYVAAVSKKRKDYYYSLLDLGVDVIWTNHPHIIRETEIIGDTQTGILKNAIIYGNGNLISAQRWEPDFSNPANPRDDTGDGMMLEVKFSKNKRTKEIQIASYRQYFVTTYINTAWEFVVKFLDDNFINYLEEAGRKNWADYIRQRKKISEKYKEKILWH